MGAISNINAALVIEPDIPDGTPEEDDENPSLLDDVMRHRAQLAEFIPSLAKTMREENKSEVDRMSHCQMQASLIDHLEAFIQSTALPAITELDKLRNEFYIEAIKSKQQMEVLSRKNSLLEAEMEDADKATIEAEKIIERLLMGRQRHQSMDAKLRWMDHNQCAIRRRSDLDKNMLESLAIQLAESETKLNEALQDVDKHVWEKEQLLDIMRTWNEKLKEYEQERDLAKLGKVACEKKLEDLQEQLDQKIEDINRIRSESQLIVDDYNKLNLECPVQGRGGRDSSDVVISYDCANEDNPGYDKEYLVAGDWELESDRRLNNHSIDCNMWTLGEEIEDCQQSTDGLTPKDRPSCDSVIELSMERREVVALGIEKQSSLALEDDLVFSKNVNINIWETSPKKSTNVRPMSSKARSFPRNARKTSPGDRRVRSKLRTSYLKTLGPKPKPIVARGTKNFQETLTLFRKLEMANPKRVEPRSLVQDMLSILNKNHPNDKGRRKEHFLNTKYKGYLTVSKSNNVPADLIKQFGYTFYFCLGKLPETTNTNANEPFWTKDKSKDCCRPCLFWFENEHKYVTLQKETKSMDVRTKDFQMSFSQLALGMVVIPPNSAVDANEEDAVTRLRMHSKAGVDVIVKAESETLLGTWCKTKRDFFLVTPATLREEEMFVSHGFRAGSEEETERWIFSIRRLLTRSRVSAEKILSIKSPERPRHIPVSSLVFCENGDTRRASSMGDYNEPTANVKDMNAKRRTMSSPAKPYSRLSELKASGGKEGLTVAKEIRSPSKSLFESNHDAPPNSSLSRPAVGEIAKAFNKKASKLKQEQRRASVRSIEPERKVRRRSRIFTYEESVKRLNERRRPLGLNNHQSSPIELVQSQRRTTVPMMEDEVVSGS